MASNNEFIEYVSKDANAQLLESVNLLERVNSQIKAINATPIKLPSQAKANGQQSASAINQTNTAIRQQEQLTIRLAAARTKDAIEIAKQRIQLAELTKENKKQAQEVLGVIDAYGRLNNELNTTRAQAKAVAADMFILEQAGDTTSDTYNKLSGTYANLSGRVNLLDTGLKKIDSGLGQSQRHVGDYARGWNGLGNAINQLTREAPAFAVSLNTGFLAISNNLPILFDEISNLTKANKELAAQGKPTNSVLKALAGSLFSLQTALSVGVTLLTLYGKELVNWASSLFSVKTNIDQVVESQVKLSDAQSKSAAAIRSTAEELKGLFYVTTDPLGNIDARNESLKQLRATYYYFLKDFTDTEILAGKANTAIEKINASIAAQSRLRGLEGYKDETVQRIEDINKELEVRVDFNREAQKLNQEYQKIAADNYKKLQAGTRTETDGKRQEEALKAVQTIYKERDARVALLKTKNDDVLATWTEIDLANEIIRLNETALTTNKDIQKDRELALLLDIKEDKAAKEQKIQTENLADVESSLYAARVKNLETLAAINDNILTNEEQNFSDRAAASERYYDIQSELAEMAYNETVRLANLQTKEEIAQIEKRAKDGEISQKNANQVIYSLQQKLNADTLVAKEDWASKNFEIDLALQNSLKGVYNQISDQGRQNLLDEKALADLRELSRLYQNVDGNTTVEQFQKLEKTAKKLEEEGLERERESLRIDLQRVQSEMERIRLQEGFTENNEAYNKLKEQELGLQTKIEESTLREAQAKAAIQEQLVKATNDYLKAISDSTLSDFGLGALNNLLAIDEQGKSTFEKLLEGAETFGAKFAVAFNAITEVAQEAFAFLQQNQDKYYDARFADLKRQYEIDTAFAGDSADAKAEIDRQYEEQQRALRIQQAKAQKETAIFNAVINTAQGITAALASFPPNPILAAVIAAVGAAQIATISSQPLPAYAEGTDYHMGGKAIVGDGGRPEVIQLPSGRRMITPSVSTVVDLPRGSKVYPDIAAAGLLDSRLPGVPVNGDGGQVLDALNKIYGAVNGSSYHVNIDKAGVSSWASSGHNRKVDHSNRVSFKGTVIGRKG